MNDANKQNGEAGTKSAARRAALQKIAAFGAAAPVMVAMLSATKAVAASTGPSPTPTPVDPT